MTIERHSPPRPVLNNTIREAIVFVSALICMDLINIIFVPASSIEGIIFGSNKKDHGAKVDWKEWQPLTFMSAGDGLKNGFGLWRRSEWEWVRRDF
jgi:hypothetical protein